MDRTSTSPTSGPREDQPQAWVNLSLPAVARHVLVIRRRRMRRAVAAVEGRLRGRRDRFAREWRALRHKLEQHLAKERTWMRGDPVPSGRVASANQEHEFLQDRLTSWQAGLEAEGDRCAARWATWSASSRSRFIANRCYSFRACGRVANLSGHRSRPVGSPFREREWFKAKRAGK